MLRTAQRVLFLPLIFISPAVSYSASTSLRTKLIDILHDRKLPKAPLLGSLPFFTPSVLKGILTPSGIKPDVSTIMRDVHKLHGENFKFYMPGEGKFAGNRVVAFVSNIEVADFVLRNTDTFSDRGWLLNGLLRRIPESLNAIHGGEIYKQHRTAVAMIFGRKHLDSYFESTAIQCEDLGRELRGNVSGRRTEVDITDLLLSHVMRNFGTSVIGHRFTESQLAILEKDAWELQLGSVIDISFPRELRLGAKQRNRRAMTRMKKLISSLTTDDFRGNHSPLLQSFATVKDANGVALSNDEVNGAIANLFLAGYFTTAFTTKWVLWRLAQHPEYQQRIYDELKGLGGFNSISSEDLSKKLQVSRAFIYESMRCFPTVPVHSRRAKKDAVLPSGTKIRENEVIFVNNFQIFNDPKTWGNDANDFNPERWPSEYLESTAIPNGFPGNSLCPYSKVKKEVSKFAYAPFGRGHRACPAAEFSLLVVQMTVLKFVETTKMESTNKAVLPSIGFALGNIGGCFLKLSPR